jgi:hypothetical protein
MIEGIWDSLQERFELMGGKINSNVGDIEI